MSLNFTWLFNLCQNRDEKNIMIDKNSEREILDL